MIDYNESVHPDFIMKPIWDNLLTHGRAWMKEQQELFDKIKEDLCH